MKYITVIVATFLISSCVSTPTIDSMIAEGGEVVEGGIGSILHEEGTTLSGVDGTWAVFLAPDGTKEVSIIATGEKASLSWRFNEDGAFCEIMMASRQEECSNKADGKVLIMTSDGVFSQFTDGVKGKYPFKVAAGNARDL